MEIIVNQPVGVILAGGQARRMGGGDKGRLPLGKGSILGHVIDRLHPQVAELALNANGDAARASSHGSQDSARSIEFVASG